MAFSEETRRRAFDNAGGKCEICGKKLVYANRGPNGGRGKWEAHHKVPVSKGGSDSLRNCMVLCYDCHQRPQKAAASKKSSGSGFDWNPF